MISFRRHYLDLFLSQENFTGKVIDIGGKKENRRGRFTPPLQQVESWIYLNIDPAVHPDILASADKIPVADASYDVALLCEVLEHVPNPHDVLKEAARILKPGGKLVISMPFLYGVHGDPYDFQRWTAQLFADQLKTLNMSEVKITPMGGVVAVLCDLYEQHCFLSFEKDGKLKFFQRVLRILIRRVFLKMLVKIDENYRFRDFVTTGYFVQAKKQ